MISFAAICPHPPIIVPGIGTKEDLSQVGKTIKAMEKLSDEIAEVKPETIIIISPHGLVYQDRMNIIVSPKLSGDFGNFGVPDIRLKYNGDFYLAKEIHNQSNRQGISTILHTDPDNSDYELDHGVMVPLYYLSKNLPKQTKIIPINYSYLDRAQHFGFGQVIWEVCNSDEFKDQEIAIISSGDLSHRLFQGAPAGYSKSGSEFDRELVELIKGNQVQEILEMDERFLEDAGECGYRSILILYGLLNGMKYIPEILSYEGPFGVGYLVANFKLQL